VEENNFEFSIHHINVPTELFRRKVINVRDLSLLEFQITYDSLLYDFMDLFPSYALKL